MLLKDEYRSCLHAKYNLNHENQVILLMIPKEKGWHYLALKAISIIKRNNLQKIMVLLVVWIVFHKVESNKKVCKIKMFVVF